MSAVEDYLKAHEAEAIATLKAFCRIPSLSADPVHRDDIRQAAAFAAELLREAGVPKVEIVETPGHPCILAEWCEASGAPTVLVYGHYDVQPPDPLDKWHSPPFAPEILDDRIFARGVSDDKGSLLIPIRVVAAVRAVTGKLPLNLKIMSSFRTGLIAWARLFERFGSSEAT